MVSFNNCLAFLSIFFGLPVKLKMKITGFWKSKQARKALRALRGLVKLQAHVRGYLVRKQATATLHRMQALIRAQATVRSQRVARGLINSNNRFDSRARKSMVNIQIQFLCIAFNLHLS